MTSFAVGLSKRERALLAEWEKGRRRTVTFEDIKKRTGPGAARVTASRLVKKRVLDRIGRGLYAVRPFRAVGETWAFPALVGVEQILRKDPHYVGGLAAFTLNRLTQQQHGSLIDVFVPAFRRSRRVGNARVVFHRRDPAVFGVGVGRVEVDGVAVAVSDPERTVIDALDQFRVVGGMAEAIRLFRGALPKLDLERLVAAALAISRSSTCQRLGLLLEREGSRGAAMKRLRKRAEESTGVHLLVPGRPRLGRVHPVWKIIENDKAGTR